MDNLKRKSFLQAAMEEFAANGYKKTSTDAIISKAGISKGLLFHYFGTKRSLYLYLFEYANKIIMDDYYNIIDYNEKDILERIRMIVLIKLEITKRYPDIFKFVSSAYFEKDSAVASEIGHDVRLLYTEASGKLFENIDLTLFKPDIDTKRAIEIILYTLRGYSEAQASPDKNMEDYNKEHQRYIKEVNEYIVVLKAAFYTEGIK